MNRRIFRREEEGVAQNLLAVRISSQSAKQVCQIRGRRCELRVKPESRTVFCFCLGGGAMPGEKIRERCA